MNQTDPTAHLRAAFAAGCRIQAWHLNDAAANSNDGRWDTLTPPEGREPEFGCALHLYRVHPEDEAKALAVWNVRMPTAHLPKDVRHYIERLVSNSDPAGLVRANELLRVQVKQLSALLPTEPAPGDWFGEMLASTGSSMSPTAMRIVLPRGSASAWEDYNGERLTKLRENGWQVQIAYSDAARQEQA